ncbi:MAG: hypothetical protein UW86_C0014G0002 [Microgenomates group bacterium GW2011_GWA1_Microgenomates_45_10]|nr:MAG: hypothetical protein UW69_C0047G0011 [Microgenomates group bacterium GW2011_GWA2_44_7]KKT77935.1 MAG: hypothetical protein UW73_C0009G0034 [Microgenomates group bacterium GW2011_GWB1_44_8]KKT86928.1 MAG: hypothetical protein UW86_C0014G0002 [Microgenomates group bacterium GW2011_GWA1_Microgenomates_45_10]
MVPQLAPTPAELNQPDQSVNRLLLVGCAVEPLTAQVHIDRSGTPAGVGNGHGPFFALVPLAQGGLSAGGYPDELEVLPGSDGDHFAPANGPVNHMIVV